MRIGLFISSTGGVPLERMIERFGAAETAGLQTAWAGNTFDWDALTLLALAGRATRRIELGSWVVPAPTRHPVALEQQAITTQHACTGRLALGIGASHPAVIEKRLGLDAGRPLREMREQLALLPRLLAGERTDVSGELYRVAVQLEAFGSAPPPVLLAALGPRMLELAGRAADGVAIWLGGERFLENHALARLDAGAASAGRPRPRVVVGLPLCITTHPTAREAAERYVGPSARLPAYRSVLDRQGMAQAAEVALMGDEDRVSRDLVRLAALGVTDFNAIPFPVPEDPGSFDRTLAFLAGQARTTR
jgi:F420-dependent oxidoreductase-like protein